ncbi:MAG: hypothetical protein E7219_05120 [Clostridiales bacterium]|nr:hypothetical protein [Clostridiales bacterium]
MEKSIARLIRVLLVLVMTFAMMPMVPGTVQTVEADSTVSTQSLSYGYAYDCQRDPAYPAKDTAFKGHHFMAPLTGYHRRGTEYQGNWQLYNRGKYKDFNKKTDNFIAYVDRIRQAYGLESPDDIPVHELKNGSEHIAYGVLIALTDDEREAFFIGDTWFGGGGYVLSVAPIEIVDKNTEHNFNADKSLKEIMVDPSYPVEPEPEPEPTPEPEQKQEPKTSPAVTQYTITYDLDGGKLDGQTGTVSAKYDKGTVITLPKPTRKGYTFDHWEGSAYNAGDNYTVTEDHTFKAVWKKAASGKAGKSGGSSSKGVDTGDENNLVFWIALMTAALIGVAGMTIRMIRREN